MIISLIFSSLVAFFITLFVTPHFINYFKSLGFVGIDVHKKEKPKVAEMGGVPVIFGFLAGIFLFIWLQVFFYGKTKNLVEMFASISTILIIFIIGFLDDISSVARKGKKKKSGLKQWQKPLLTLPASIPLIAIMAGNSVLHIPFIGPVDTGILYPLLIVPIAVVGASNAINMLAGLNGLEAGMSSVLLFFLGIYSFLHGSFYPAVLALCFAFSLFAFLIYNKYPAKIFPGDSLCYSAGACVAAVTITANIEKYALLCFLPWFFELILKMRTRFKGESFGKLTEDGRLIAPEKCTSLTHVVMKLGKFGEKGVVAFLIIIEIILCVLAWFVVGVL